MKKFYENLLTVLGGSILIVCFLFLISGCGSAEIKTSKQQQSPVNVDSRFTIDTFKIVSIDDKGNIEGDLIDSSAANTEWSTSEGIHLETLNQEDWSTDLRTLEVGDTIQAVYYTADYKMSIWDNILDIRKIN